MAKAHLLSPSLLTCEMDIGIVSTWQYNVVTGEIKLAYVSIYIRTRIENVTHNANFAQDFYSNI